jgi:glycosyltransferase involved in cell wall biosynthesis
MRKLHVLHVIGGGDTGGAMTHLLPLLSALERAGCDVHLACLGDGGLARQAMSRGLSVAVLAMSNPRDIRVLAPLRRMMAGGPAGFARFISGDDTARRSGRASSLHVLASRWDVVHTHGMRANLPVRLAIGTVPRRPSLVTTVHSDLRLDYGSSVAQMYEALDRVTLRVVDKFVCVSDALRLLLIDRGYPKSRLVTVRSGVDIPPAAGGDAALGVAGPTGPFMEPGSHAPRIGTIARLVAAKDLELLLLAARSLLSHRPSLEVLIVGAGPEAPRLQALVTEQGLTGTVRFTGQLDDVRQLLAALDVYMVTSLFEGGVSMSVLEAMAAGKPVVTTDCGGVAEAVVDGVTGYVVGREQERGALAAALAGRAALLLDDPVLRARMGAAGAERVRMHFTVKQAAALTRRVYERCVAARDARF